ncbi:hypothetical protein [Halorubrum coriense]|uniref:hypothetical protein n=1 Tax=Halorubrum coriense TaxID=64713 RepID=UPI0012692BAD|nr:hypothetical protein [Halorubrum coriense]
MSTNFSVTGYDKQKVSEEQISTKLAKVKIQSKSTKLEARAIKEGSSRIILKAELGDRIG